GSSGRVGTVDAGGAEYLATHIAELRASNPDRTFVVSAGDLIGASPLISGLFHDEPTIEAMNRIGLDFNAVGNHEFDEGVDELVRMQEGGCHPVDGCLDGDGFDGAQFRFLSANVEQESSGKPLFKRYAIASRGGVKVGFVGLTLEGTPTIVAAAGIRGYRFLDEVESINRVIPELRAKGVDAIVVLIHEGGLPARLDPNGCAGVSGPIVDIVDQLEPAVDLVISGHTH
ncbi:MAG: metallophosphoesterase, partial [Panacagrimonas sp.]